MIEPRKPYQHVDLTTEPSKVNVRTYRNLHGKTFSIQAKLPRFGWRVVAYGADFVAADVSFVISDAGRQRARREKTKNVHAWACPSSIVAPDGLLGLPELPARSFPITYSPYNDLGFHADGVTLESWPLVWFTADCHLYGLEGRWQPNSDCPTPP